MRIKTDETLSKHNRILQCTRGHLNDLKRRRICNRSVNQHSYKDFLKVAITNVAKGVFFNEIVSFRLLLLLSKRHNRSANHCAHGSRIPWLFFTCEQCMANFVNVNLRKYIWFEQIRVSSYRILDYSDVQRYVYRA